MIDTIIVGSGSARKVVPLVRDRDQRASAAGALKGFLFPTAAAHRKAMNEGSRRAFQYREARRAGK